MNRLGLDLLFSDIEEFFLFAHETLIKFLVFAAHPIFTEEFVLRLLPESSLIQKWAWKSPRAAMTILET
jgi:hypothetical protein